MIITVMIKILLYYAGRGFRYFLLKPYDFAIFDIFPVITLNQITFHETLTLLLRLS